ncbi:MAG: OmpA family protein [Spirochaetota bacterium]
MVKIPRKFLFFLFLCVDLLFSSQVFAEKFSYKYRAGEKYRILYEVDQIIKINGRPVRKSNVLYKVAVNTLAAKEGAGHLDCIFQTSDSIFASQNSFVLRDEYRSNFWRDRFGVITIEDKFYMPVIRNVPRFPGKEIAIGESWTADAYEVHDFRKSYKLKEYLRFPVKVHYTYVKNTTIGSKKLAVFKVHYTVFHKTKYQARRGRAVPHLITGFSEQLYYWDVEQGRLHSRSERFDYFFHLSDRQTVEYLGTSKGTYFTSPKLDKKRVAQKLNEELQQQGIDGTTVKQDKKGVTLSLDNIQFKPFSAQLTEAEKSKLEKIAKLIKKFPSRDFLITGHTARVGSESSSQSLSEKRAQAVANFLLKVQALQKRQVTTTGRGSKEPLVDNATDAGRKKNRRVEITILEN